MLATVAHDRLKFLAATTNEKPPISRCARAKALFIDHAATRHVIAISGQTGELVPLYCTSHGKALLADFDEQSLHTLFGNKPFKAWTPNTILSTSKLAKQCAEIRVRGYATDESGVSGGRALHRSSDSGSRGCGDCIHRHLSAGRALSRRARSGIRGTCDDRCLQDRRINRISGRINAA